MLLPYAKQMKQTRQFETFEVFRMEEDIWKWCETGKQPGRFEGVMDPNCCT